MNFIEAGVMSDGESVTINLYNALDATVRTGKGELKVHVGGEYLSDCRATLTLTFSGEPVPVRLRVPAWSAEGTVTVGDATYAVTPGYFTFLPKNRCERVTVAFDDTVRVVPILSDPERGDLPWKRDRWVSQISAPVGSGTPKPEYISALPEHFLSGGACLLVRGASLLCRTKLIGNTEGEMFGDRHLTAAYKCTSVERIYTPHDVNTELLVTFSNGEHELRYHVADYATGTNVMSEDKCLFSIYF